MERCNDQTLAMTDCVVEHSDYYGVLDKLDGAQEEDVEEEEEEEEEVEEETEEEV